MTLSSLYQEYLVETIIRASLKQGVVLSEKEIQQKLDEIIKTNPELDQPFLRKDIYMIEEDSVLSSSKINSIMHTIYNDLSIAYTALVDQAKSVTSTYDSVVAEFKSIEKRIKILEEKTENLFLSSDHTEGYLDYVVDTFNNKDKINTSLSSVFIDNKTGIITLPILTQKRIKLNLIDSDLQFNVITRENLLLTKSMLNSPPLNAFSDDENIWVQQIQMSRGEGTIISDLIVRMPEKNKISKIIFKPAVSDAGNISTITLQYSNDGLNWYNIEGQKSVPLRGTVSMLFSPVEATYWKFVFTKASYDDHKGDVFIYEFGAKSIQFYGVGYKSKDHLSTGVFYSNILKGKQSFNRVTLKVCEQLPQKTNINYSVAALTQQEIDEVNNGIIRIEDLHYYLIDPITRENPVNPTLIDFEKVTDFNGINSSYQKNDTINFRYKSDINTVVDYIVPTNIIKSELKILRNVGDNKHGQSYQPFLANDISLGWKFDGTYYSCNFYIEEESGKVIDFGKNNLEIDRYTINGKTTIKKGFHTIKTHKDNWRVINPSEIISEENPDTLYPYNHKYLIEGISDLLYDMDLTEEINGKSKKEILDPLSIYSGVERYWSKTLEEVSDFDYGNNIAKDNYDIFSFVIDYSGNERIAIKDSKEPGLLIHEKLAIITRAVSSDLHEGIVIKANLKSEDPELTPVLDQYIIRLGI